MLKILHLTDIHICDTEVLNKLRPVFNKLFDLRDTLREIRQEIPPELALDYADEGRLTNIIDIVRHEKPELIVITGDITTFGDKKSFERAQEFVRSLRLAGEKNKELPIVITVPGNHDVLAGAMKALSMRISTHWDGIRSRVDQELPKFINGFPFPFGLLGRIFIKSRLRRMLWSSIENLKEAVALKTFKDELDALLNDPSINASETDPWNNYESFNNEGECHLGHFQKPYGNIKVLCTQYDSVSRIPYFLNLGITSPEKFNRFEHENRRENIVVDKDDLFIVLLHHNPISSPAKIETPLTNAYNSMPGGSVFIKSMLNRGADLILYGHQHEDACFKIDVFQAEGGISTKGHLFLLGGASATIGEHAGFGVIEVESRFVARVTKYTVDHNTGQYHRAASSLPLIFENNYPLDTPTISTRKEIRNSSYNSSNMGWDQILEEHEAELFLIGPRQESLIETDPIEKAIISNNCSVNVLLSDPKLFKFITSGNMEAGVINRLNEIWDREREYSWRNQSMFSAQAIVELLNLWEKLQRERGAQYSDKLKIRISHTLMSIGARGKNISSDTGKLLIRLLPVGVFSDFRHLPVLTLKKRYDKALFDYYSQYIIKLWEHGRSVDNSSKSEYDAIGKGTL
ncbi:MAG TPA: metallophosphoesterase [Pyrinomonadaceae bacterium]|jgi:hypothetical protein